MKRHNTGLGRAFLLSAAILLAAPPRRAPAAPSLGTFSMSKCRGATPVPGDDPTIFTTVPDAWSITISSTTANLACPATLPTPQLISNAQALWHENTVDSAANANHLTVNGWAVSGAASPTCDTSCGFNTCTWPSFDSPGKFGWARKYPAVYTATCQDTSNVTQAFFWYAYGYDTTTSAPLQNTFQGGSWSVEAWVKSPGPPYQRTTGNSWEAPILTEGRVDTAGVGCNDDKCVFLGFTNKYLRIDFGNHYTLGKTQLTDTASWHHVAFVYDRSSNAQYVYLDGQLDNDGSSPYGTAKSTPLATTGLSSIFRVGGGVSLWPPISGQIEDGNAFGGSIDELRIVNYALSAQEVAAHWTGQGYAKNGTYTGYGSCGASQTYNQASFSLGTLTSGSTVGFFAEDTAESVGYKNITLTIDQTALTPPVLDASSVTSVGSSSITWNWGSNYFCKSSYGYTTYDVELINNGIAGAWVGNGTSTQYAASSLSPNRLYGLSVRATYTDTGGSSQIIGPSAGSLEIDATTYAAVPGAPTGSFTSGTAFTLAVNANGNPDGTGGTNATQYQVQRSTTDTGQFYWISDWSTTATRSLTLSKSSKYVFKVKARNANSIETPLGSVSTATYVTQPNVPTNLQGAAGGACPKTEIQWTWSNATMGSGSAAQAYVYGSAGGWASGLQASASYVKTGLTPATLYGAYVQAYDSGATAATGGQGRDNSLSAVSATSYATTEPADTPAPMNLTGASQTTAVAWNWTAPTVLCSGGEYRVIDAAGGTVLATGLAAASYPPWTQSGMGTNVKSSVHVQARDTVATNAYGASYWSPLSLSATAYSLANAPTTLSLTSISTGGVAVSWNANSNPSYTRYEVTFSPDNFAVTTSTRLAVSDNFTSTSTNLTGLGIGTTYYVRVRAFNGKASDSYGGTGSSFLSGSFVTKPAAPSLAGTPLSVSSVRWDWTQVSGAAGYNLYDGAGNLMTTGGSVSYTSSTLSVNARYDAQIEAYGPGSTGAGARSTAFTYTLAQTPASPSVASTYVSSASLSWSGGNPSYTNYEVSVATDPNYAVVVATLGVTGTVLTVANLFPETSYYARIRAYNGVQVPTSFASFPTFMTRQDPSITISSTSASPYVSASGLVGSWQFDEGSGTAAADGSSYANAVGMQCLTSGCSSTPTFAAGPSGLGWAASFSGLIGSVALSNAASPFNFTGSLSVEAWVNPQTVAQQSGAGIVARGSQGAEDFALDVFGNAFRFIATPSKTVSAPSAIPAGQWTHLAGVYDSASGSAALYVNGQPAASVSGVGARSNSGQTLSIGNRRDSAGTSYSLGFLGKIDAVRVFNRALTAAEVAADYAGSFTSTVAAASPNSGILVALPPNAFGAPARIFITNDPVNHPIHTSAAALSAGLSAAPSGLTLVPGSMVEIVPLVGGVPYTAPLGSSATVSIPYADADGDDLIDGTSPPLAASSLQVYTLNTSVNRWEALFTAVDTVNKRATAVTPHFSVFAVFAPATVQANLSSIRVYPVPWKPGTGGLFDAAGVTFDNLPASGDIRIISLAGEGVRSLSFNGASAGRVVWDGLNDSGRRAASGVYFARVAAGGTSVLLKFAIER